jgi:hypothetical protein
VETLGGFGDHLDLILRHTVSVINVPLPPIPVVPEPEVEKKKVVVSTATSTQPEPTNPMYIPPRTSPIILRRVPEPVCLGDVLGETSTDDQVDIHTIKNRGVTTKEVYLHTKIIKGFLLYFFICISRFCQLIRHLHRLTLDGTYSVLQRGL